jgi:putative flavoprotein involved in K+ transport
MAGDEAARTVALMSDHFETIVIGAGQAGLSVGHHLARRQRSFLILEANDRIGDNWRNRYDSLRLYSPARYDGLPGWDMPLDGWTYPTKDELGDYLEAYAQHFELPVVTGISVDQVRRHGEHYVVRAGAHRFEAANVVVASGTFQEPIVPEFAHELDPSIRQLHSDDYRNPSQLQPGPVLVVGASHSGADLALELAPSHETVLSGRVHGELPFELEGPAARRLLPVLWFVWNHVLTMRTPLGRRMRREVRAHGGPLLRVKRAHLGAAGVERTDARVAGVRDGRPVLDDGRVLDVANVVWCTGFGKDLSWLDVPVAGDDGWPEQIRGAVASSPGLYFVGLPFLYAFASMLVGGVGRDAERVAEHIVARSAQVAAEPAPALV